MNNLEMKANWNMAKGILRQLWGDATDEDLDYTKRRTDNFVGRFRKRTGESRQAVEEAIGDASYTN